MYLEQIDFSKILEWTVHIYTYAKNVYSLTADQNRNTDIIRTKLILFNSVSWMNIRHTQKLNYIIMIIVQV